MTSNQPDFPTRTIKYSNIAKQFGRNLFLHRAQRNMSQRELAKQACVHQSLICKIEGGMWAPRLDTYLKLERALDLPRGTLLAGIVVNHSNSKLRSKGA